MTSPISVEPSPIANLALDEKHRFQPMYICNDKVVKRKGLGKNEDGHRKEEGEDVSIGLDLIDW